ncbi:MAG TPA: diaminopimelate decarboxylase [Chitinispirillaceae bacterium]|nr:diaminopimelate decarboxylase [Chitinispirillaceae bacterium]
MEKMIQFPLQFGNDTQLKAIADKYGTPLMVHDARSYHAYAKQALSVPDPFGITVRYAMKANSNSAILHIFDELGIHIDASSVYEVKRALAAGISPEKILLTSQQALSKVEIKDVVESGVNYCCTSLTQLQRYCELFSQSRKSVSVRINPGLGSGHNNRTNTAGLAASFGIWHEYIPEVKHIALENGLKINRIHTHVGSGSDWEIWKKAVSMTLEIIRHFPDATVLNLGGGYKIDRNFLERSIDLHAVFTVVKRELESFASETGRKLTLEIEPGTYLAANACMLLASVNDIVDTGANGYHFLKIDASMTELLRPMIYGAKHPIRLLNDTDRKHQDYVVVGCCCESGDIFTVCDGDPEAVATVSLPEAHIGDVVAIMGTGAYGISMSAKNYNSRPICAEVMIWEDGTHSLISRRQDVEEIWEREIA